MAGETRVPEDLLGDSAATLRQVEGVLGDFQTPEGADGEVPPALEIPSGPAGIQDLVKILVSTHNEIMDVIVSLRSSRGLLEQAAMERLKSTHQKLAEVSSATEVAATGMLDGLDRALVLVDHIEADAKDGSDADAGSDYREELRDELHQLINLLQFQDITSQQLGYAASVLADVETRIVRLAQAFDVHELGMPELSDAMLTIADHQPPEEVQVVCDPNASTLDAADRQALADSIFPA